MSPKKLMRFRKTLPGRLGSEVNANQVILRKQFGRIANLKTLVPILVFFGILILRLLSFPPSIDYDDLSLPKTEDRDEGTTATTTATASLNTALSSFASTDSDGTSTAPNSNSNADTKADSSVFDFEKYMQSTTLTNYSYGTTDVDEFMRLHRSYLYNRQQELNDSYLSTKARSKDANGNNMTTYSHSCHYEKFIGGFRNQMMAFTALIMLANYNGHKQLLLDSLMYKDTLASSRQNPIDFYFDVEHWNRYSYNEEKNKDDRKSSHPNWLPRMVLSDPSIHDEWDPSRSSYKENQNVTKTRPYGFEYKSSSLFSRYTRYDKGKGILCKDNRRNPAEILMLQGAMRPHPALQAVIDRSKKFLQERAHSTKSSFRYMTLHARVEPDMQKHIMCNDKKVLTLQEIVDMIESKWPDEPPVDIVFLPINRKLLEKEGKLPKNFENDTKKDEKRNWIAADNLQLLNRLTSHKDSKDGKSVGGMWNGKVPVVEFGADALYGTVYEHRPAISGAILDYYLALDADIFIGTEVSTFSQDILAARFFRGFSDSDTNANAQTSKRNLRNNNYKYLPGGLNEWITDDMVDPPNFDC
jgi:hypothetical protein